MVRREWFIFSIGIIIFLLPFLGFPRQFNSFVLVCAGLLLLALSLRNIRQTYVQELGLTKPKQKSAPIEHEEANS